MMYRVSHRLFAVALLTYLLIYYLERRAYTSVYTVAYNHCVDNMELVAAADMNNCRPSYNNYIPYTQTQMMMIIIIIIVFNNIINIDPRVTVCSIYEAKF